MAFRASSADFDSGYVRIAVHLADPFAVALANPYVDVVVAHHRSHGRHHENGYSARGGRIGVI